MNLQDLKIKIKELRESKDSFDDAARFKTVLIESIKSEEFDSHVVSQSIRLSNKKVTDQLIEQYRQAASSKELTSDPITLSILENSKYKTSNKYLFVIDEDIVAIDRQMIPESFTNIDSIKSSIRRKLYG